jgi:hypothetical protein
MVKKLLAKFREFIAELDRKITIEEHVEMYFRTAPDDGAMAAYQVVSIIMAERGLAAYPAVKKTRSVRSDKGGKHAKRSVAQSIVDDAIRDYRAEEMRIGELGL